MTPSEQVKKLVCRLATGESLSTQEIMTFGLSHNAPVSLISSLRDVRLSTIGVLIDLGRPRITADPREDTPERPGPIVTDADVVTFLVSCLDDGDSVVRDRAGSVIAELVPPTSIQIHTHSVLDALQRHPSTSGALIILGKTDSPDALAMLTTIPALRFRAPDNVLMVRARLGDVKAEEALIAAYRAATDPREKGALAPRLGYVASVRTKHLLAEEMRSPDFTYWNQRSRRSLRVDIVDGLHQAFPTEPCFWRPFYTPSDDAYYSGIEKWLEMKLGISWTRPRPPFLYQEEAPSSPPTR